MPNHFVSQGTNEKRIACDKKGKLESSEVQWTEVLDETFHWVLIRGTFQRFPAASQGLLMAVLSETHQYSLRAVCLLSIPQSWLQENSPQMCYDWLWREWWQKCKIRLHSHGNVEEDGECWLMNTVFIQYIVLQNTRYSQRESFNLYVVCNYEV